MTSRRHRHTFFRYVFSIVFALGATAALFVLLEFLVTVQLPFKTTALNPTTNIRVRSITVTPKKSQTPQHKAITSNSKIENKQPQQVTNSQQVVKSTTPDKQLSSIAKAKPIKTKPIKTKSIKTVPLKAKFAKAKTKNIKIVPATTESHSKPAKPKVTKKEVQLAVNTAPVLTPALAPVLSKAKPTPEPEPEPEQQTKPIAESKKIDVEADIHNTKTYAPTIVDAKELKKIYSPNPSYPRKAQRRNIQGWVMTNFQIRTDGSVAQIEIIDGKNAIFFKNEVIKTLESWVFEKDQSQDIKASMRFVFSLRS